jgi:hypothetical protein
VEKYLYIHEYFLPNLFSVSALKFDSKLRHIVEVFWLIQSPACRENLVPSPICSGISNYFTCVRVVLGVDMQTRQTGVLESKILSWPCCFVVRNLNRLVGGRSIIGSAHRPHYNWASMVLMYLVVCLVAIQWIA